MYYDMINVMDKSNTNVQKKVTSYLKKSIIFIHNLSYFWYEQNNYISLCA